MCNRPKDVFERSEPTAYTAWIREKNGYSGRNSLRKVSRLVKYLRDITKRFECSSVMLTTLLADQIQWHDKNTADFKDTPTTLKTVFGRLDDILQRHPTKPAIRNPKLSNEDFAASMTQATHEIFRSTVHSLRGQIDEAFDAEGVQASVTSWQKIFGPDFAKGAVIAANAELLEEEDVVTALLSSTAAHDDTLVDKIAKYGRWLWRPALDRPSHMRRPMWKRGETVTDQVQVSAVWQANRHSPERHTVTDFDELPTHGGLWFDVRVNQGQPLPAGYSVRWRITNTGAIAMAIGKGRGEFNHPHMGHKRWETLEYRGVHLAEAFIIRDDSNLLVGQSAAFHVMIR